MSVHAHIYPVNGSVDYGTVLKLDRYGLAVETLEKPGGGGEGGRTWMEVRVYL